MSGVTSTGKKPAVGILIGLALILGIAASSSAGESSDRAVANGAAFHLTVLHSQPPVGTGQWIVSGFAPGLGYFNQLVPASNVSLDYPDGTASVNTTVTTSLGLSISIKVTWDTPGTATTESLSIPNPSRTLTINSKPSKVSGNIGSFNFGLVGQAVASGAVSRRNITP